MQSVRLCFKMLLQNILLARDGDWILTLLASRIVKNTIQLQGSRSVCTRAMAMASGSASTSVVGIFAVPRHHLEGLEKL